MSDNTSLTSLLLEAQCLCRECRGTGVLTIKNAYDPDFSKDEPCNFCKGTGVTNGKDRVYN